MSNAGAMAAKLAAAGVVPAAQRAKAAADAAVAGSGDFAAKVDAFYAALADDPAALLHIFEHWRTDAARPWLAEAADRQRQAGARIRSTTTAALPPHQSPPAGQRKCDTQTVRAGRAGTPSQPAGQVDHDIQPATAAGAVPPSSGQQRDDIHNSPCARPAARPDDTAGLRRVARLSRLETFTVNGQPIGKLTPREALGWAASRERDARFVRLLCANLPPDSSIAAFRTPEDADRLWDLAAKESDA